MYVHIERTIRFEHIVSVCLHWLYFLFSGATPAMDMAKCSVTCARALGSSSFILSCRLSGKCYWVGIKYYC